MLSTLTRQSIRQQLVVRKVVVVAVIPPGLLATTSAMQREDLEPVTIFATGSMRIAKIPVIQVAEMDCDHCRAEGQRFITLRG